MPADTLAFVQFIHPGPEHAPDSGEIKTWNRGPHRRKFLIADGRYSIRGEQRDGRVAFWGEWEPPSRVVARYPARGDRPRYIHEPFLERPSSFRGVQNTDPYVFGDRFLYTGCQQHTNHGSAETQLRRLSRGSVILLGSCRGLARFVVDTVFVVADYVDHSFLDYEEVLHDIVEDDYRIATLGPWYVDGGDTSSYRLYIGATPNDPVASMSSFAPCVPVVEDADPAFARPEIRLPMTITPCLRQGRKITRLSRVDEAVALWTQVVRQVESEDLGLATHLDVPSIEAHARTTTPQPKTEACVPTRADGC